MSEIDPYALRDAFGSFLSGVTVVTTRDDSGHPLGFTANSFSSVSLNPPMLLVCPSRSLTSFPVFEQCRHFAVNILAEGQESVSNTFASFKGDRFGVVDWQPDQNGCPILAETAAHFSCNTDRAIEAGDHIVLIGNVTDFQRSGRRGLGFAAGQYFSLGLERAADDIPSHSGRAFAGVILEHDNKVLLQQQPRGLCPPQMPLESPARIRASIGQPF